MSQVHGRVAPGLDAVRDAFAENFADLDEVGGAFAVYHHGQPIVDLWGGTARVDSGEPWVEETATNVFSVTKALVATCAHLLVQRGAIDIDAHVSAYWPAFGSGGKRTITVRQLLSHQAGLAALDIPMTIEEAAAWQPVIAAIESQEPNWEPGTAHGYHGVSFGWLVGELVRRVSGKSIGAFLEAEIAGPLGLEMWIGLPGDHARPVADLIPPPPADPSQLDDFMRSVFDPTTLTGRAFLNPPIYPLDHNTALIRQAEVPSSNGIMTARALAKLYAALIGDVGGVRLLSTDSLALATEPQAVGRDCILLVDSAFSLGYMRPSPKEPMGGRASSFGHPGAGGSTGLADPAVGLAFGYVTNKMQRHPATDPRAARLIDATYASLGL